jgi:hypothetical protein
VGVPPARKLYLRQLTEIAHLTQAASPMLVLKSPSTELLTTSASTRLSHRFDTRSNCKGFRTVPSVIHPVAKRETSVRAVEVARLGEHRQFLTGGYDQPTLRRRPWLLVELAAHPFESGLGEVRQRRIAMLVASQHPKSHQAKQHGTGHFICRA